jgi:two-component system, chemotaxis family, sensor kinase CheA
MNEPLNLSNSHQPNFAGLAEKIALELVFAEPGKDTGLLPINSLLDEIEGSFTSFPASEPVQQAVGIARQWVDSGLEAGALDAELIKRLGLWSSWMREALAGFAQGLPCPALPTALTVPLAVQSPRTAEPLAARSECEEALHVDVAGNADLLREFVQEAQEHLLHIELDALTLENNPGDADAINSLFRSFHTLKGGSGFLNLPAMNRLAHELETLLDLLRQGKLRAQGGITDIILSGRDALRQIVNEIERRLAGEAAGEPILVSSGDLLRRIRAVQDGPEANVPLAPASATPSGPEPVTPAAPSTRSTAGVVKVDTVKLDNLIDLVGELVIAQSLVVQDADLRSRTGQNLTRNLVHLGRITSDLQHTAMSLRMVPIRATFQKMTRVVRDLAAKASKLVELRLSGEDTELDRNLIEEINDPLVHMIRNAVDHGIEPPQQREALGKPAQGIIHLRAGHQGGNIIIEITDDGAGLNKERILAKGIEAGLVSREAQPSEQDIFSLIFAPGFSTAEKVTEISGRGVGMDVVRRNISKLRGKIEIKSTLGAGSTFSIHVPLTLAIIDGLIFSIGHERFIVPTLCVRESFRPDASMISTVLNRGEIVSVRGQLSPLVRLYERFGLQPEHTDPAQGIIIVVETNHQSCSLLVDRLLGKQEVVIKGLGDAFKQSRALAGAAILGDGRVGLILDVNGLLHPENRPAYN